VSEIRSATESDEAAVVALWRACGLVVWYNDPNEDFRFALAGPSSAVLVAPAPDGAIIGSVMVGHDGHRGWVYYLAADPARRGEGIGRGLLRAAEEWLKARGVPKIQLLVRETNTAVTGFYERAGYEVSPVKMMQKWLRER
jgi:ribosomal protein S18 acetylase RimI-like enzyme